MKNFLKKIVSRIENSPLTFSFWAVSFISLIVARILVENWLIGFESRGANFLFFEFSHTFLFFLFAYVVFLGFLVRFLKFSLKAGANLLLFGFLVILFPPIIDSLISGGRPFWSFYEFDGLKGLIIQFFTYFDDTPDVGVTYGVRVEIALVVVFMLILGYLQTDSKIKAFLSGLITYSTLFILGTLPSWITLGLEGWKKGFWEVGETDVARIFLTPINIFSVKTPDLISTLNIKMSLIFALMIPVALLAGLVPYNWKKIRSFVESIRFPQLTYHGGLLVIGIGLASLSFPGLWRVNFFNITAFLVMVSAVFSAWLASVAVNDAVDLKIDEKTNRNRPLVKGIFTKTEYAQIGAVFFFASIFLSSLVSFKAAMFLLAYQALAWIYSAWPLRLKRVPLVATFLGAVASVMILFAGYVLVSPDHDLERFPSAIAWLLLIGYTLSLTLKDIKDIEGDKADGVMTIPVIFGEEKGRMIIGGGILLSYLLSVAFLNESDLLLWAFLLGSASFWIANNKKINPRHLAGWMMAPVFVYGLIVVKIIFF